MNGFQTTNELGLRESIDQRESGWAEDSGWKSKKEK